MSSQLEVGIGANIDNLKKGLSEAEKALNDFSKETKSITDKLQKNAIETSKLRKEITSLDAAYAKGTISESNYGKGMLDLVNKEKKLSAETKSLRANLSTLNKSANDLGGKGMNTLKKGAVSGNAAMTSFSRTIQDAPFGIMGVSNNITNLTEQFGYLKNKTGSAKGALQAMLRDLKGFGGISLGISLVTSALLLYSRYVGKAAKDTNALVDAQKDLIASSQKDINTLNSLLSIAKDENIAKKDRLRSIKKINELYGEYLPNLNLENIGTKNVTKSINSLTTALIRQAKIKGLTSRLSELYAEKYKEETIASTKVASSFTQILGGLGIKSKTVAERMKPVNKELSDLKNKITELLKEDLSLDGIFTETNEKRQKIQPFEIEPLDTTFYDETLKLWKSNVTDLVSFSDLEGGVNWSNLFNAQQLLEQTNQAEAVLNSFNGKLSSILENGLENSIGGIGESLGTALSEGNNVLSGVGESLLASLGNILTQIGQMAIAVGVGLKAIKTALESLNPFVAIAAGAGLIALGSYFSSKSKSIAGGIGGNGGGSSGASGGGSYSGGSTRTAPSVSSGFGGGTVVFEISGNKLIGVLNNTLSRNKSLGGNLSLG